MGKVVRRQGCVGRTLLLSVSALAAGFWLPASAQDAGSSSVRGVVALPERGEVTLRIRNVDTGNEKPVAVDEEGRYRIDGLSPGRYRVIVADGDAETYSNTITVRLGEIAELNVEQSSSDEIIDEIVVVGRALRRPNAEVGSSLTPEQIRRLPQGNRNFLSNADTAPGVVSSPDADGNIQVRGGALRANSTNVFIDGVSQKDFVLNGGITGQDSSRGNPFPQSAIAEFNVISSNYKAEFDQVNGPAIVAVTKRGTNKLSGGVFFDFTNNDLRSRTPLEQEPGADKAETQQIQYGFNLSGPIIEDKLHIFASYERKENEDLRQIIPQIPTGLFDNLTPRVQNAIAPNNLSLSAPFEQDLYFVKVDWNASENHDFYASLRYRTENELRDIGGFNTAEAATNNIVDDTRLNITHEYRRGSLFNEATFTYEDAGRRPVPVNFQTAETFTFGRFQNEEFLIANLGGGRDFQDKGQRGWGIDNDTSWRWGSHRFKAGLTYRSLELSGIEINPFNPNAFFSFNLVDFDFENDIGTTVEPVPYRLEFTRPVSQDTPFVVSDAERIGFYIQDEWAVTDRLVVDFGLRWDFEQIDSYLDYVTPDEVVQALRANPNINAPAAGFDVEDFISDGSNREAFKGEWQPRLGFSYALTDDARHRVFGGYGRSYNRIPFDFLQLEETRERFARFNVFFEGDHPIDCNDPCIAFDPVFLEPGGVNLLPVEGSRELFALNNELRTPFTDQYSLGIRSDWGPIETEVGFTRLQSRDGFVFQLGNRQEGGLFYPEGFVFSNAPFNINISDDFSNLLLGTNGIETNSDQLFVRVEKPKRDTAWGAFLIYTNANAEENVRFGGPFEGLDPQPGFFGFFDAAGVSRHSVVGTLTADLPFGIEFSSKLTLRSSPPFYGQFCSQFEPTVICEPTQGFVPEADFIIPNAWAFRQVDFAISKNFTVSDKLGGAYARVDILNAYDHENFAPGPDRFIGPEGVNPNFGLPNGTVVGLPRTVKISVGYNF